MRPADLVGDEDWIWAVKFVDVTARFDIGDCTTERIAIVGDQATTGSYDRLEG